MKGLLISDKLHWNGNWSAEIGRNLAVHDSTHDLFIFDRRLTGKEILAVLQDVPPSLYRLLDLEEAPEAQCDFMADSGACYRQVH